MNDIYLQYQQWKKENKIIIGIDEVGRGAWAGPLVVAAVILSQPIDNLRDSKQLSKNARENFTSLIKQKASWAIVQMDVEELNLWNLHKANLELMKRAASALEDFDSICLFDGYSPIKNNNHIAIKSGDKLIPEISAASILAKTYRDNLMVKYAKKYPLFGFEKNVGYGTLKHRQSLKQYGPCEIHRKNFLPIKKLLQG